MGLRYPSNMLWIHFCLRLALAQEISSTTDSRLWSNEQVVQQVLPELQGDKQALQTQIDTKRRFFAGDEAFESAFWQWQSEDVLNINVLNSLKVSTLINNQKRLEQRFESFPFEDSNSQAATEYQAVYEQYWQGQNERDALDIKAIELLTESVKNHPSVHQELEELEAKWLRQSTILIQDSTQQDLVAKVVTERQKVMDLRRELIHHCAGGRSTLYALTKEILLEEPTDLIESEGRFDRLMILEEFVSDPHLVQQVSDEIKRIKKGIIEENRLQLLEEFQQVKQTWKTETFGWDLEKTENEIQSLIVQKQNVSDGNGQIQLDIIEYKLDVLQRHQSSLNGIQVETALQRAQEDLDAARQKELEQARSDEQAKIQSEIVRLREIETAMLSAESERHRMIQAYISDVKMRLDQWEDEFRKWKRMPPLDSSRQSTLFSLQQQIHQLQWDLQEEIGRLKSGEKAAFIQSDIQDKDVILVLDSVKKVQEDTSKHIKTEMNALLRLWIQVHQKQGLVGHFEEENVQFWFDIAFEWKHLSETVPINLEQVKNTFKDINKIFSLFWSALRWSFVGLVWVWTGRRIESWWAVFRKWLDEQDRPKMFGEVDFKAWDVPLAINQGSRSVSTVQPLFFALSSCVLVQYLGEGWIEVFGSALLLWMFARLCAPITEYLVSDSSIRRPLRRGFAAFVWIYFGLNLLIDIFVNVLYVFQSVQIVETVQWIALLIWGMVQLGVWYDLLHDTAMKVIGLQRFKEWMNRFSAGFFGRRVRSIFAMTILLIDSVSKVLFWLVEHSSIFGSTLAKNTIENTVQEHEESFDTQDWYLDWNALLRPFVETIHKDLQTMVNDSEYVSGAMCLIADEGMGKSSVLRMVMEQSDTPTHLLKVEAIIRDGNWTVEKLGDWLCDGLGISRQDSLSKVYQSIENLPNAIIGIDDIQRVFLRDVQGFEVINQLFSIIQATSGKHCWIVSCHQPTWTFWDSLSTPIRTDFFQYRYTLKPWSVLEVRSAILNMISQRGLSLDFSTLTNLNNPQAVHRAEMAFWRLLTDATKGNPSTSMQLFKQCAIRSRIENTVGIQMFSLRQSEVLNQLDDGAGFVLACVLMHNRCTLGELCNSLQMSQSLVVSICRQLVASSLLSVNALHYQIDPIWFPWIEANLAQKRFIGLRDLE